MGRSSISILELTCEETKELAVRQQAEIDRLDAQITKPESEGVMSDDDRKRVLCGIDLYCARISEAVRDANVVELELVHDSIEALWNMTASMINQRERLEKNLARARR